MSIEIFIGTSLAVSRSITILINSIPFVYLTLIQKCGNGFHGNEIERDD